MKLPTLLAIAFAGALLSASAAVGCSEPDVAGFQGSGGSSGADDDDDDTTTKTTKTTKTSKTTQSQTTGTTPTKTPAGTTTDTTGTKTTTPAPVVTPAQCFTHCVSPVPEAVALDSCVNKCADNDTDCLGNCYDSSNCGANPQCDQAIDQCGKKCPAN